LEKNSASVIFAVAHAVLLGERLPELKKPAIIRERSSSPLHARVVLVGGLVRNSVAVAVDVMHGREDLGSFERHLDDVHVGVKRGSEWGRLVKYEDVHAVAPVGTGCTAQPMSEVCSNFSTKATTL
jgi:hypothetical protein